MIYILAQATVVNIYKNKNTHTYTICTSPQKYLYVKIRIYVGIYALYGEKVVTVYLNVTFNCPYLI